MPCVSGRPQARRPPPASLWAANVRAHLQSTYKHSALDLYANRGNDDTRMHG